MKISMFGDTDVGRVRKYNQDSLYFHQDLRIGIVADGIGGRKGGDVASKLAVNGIKEEVLQTDCIRHGETKTFLISAVDKVNSNIIEEGIRKPHVKGMGTTVECMMFVSDKMYIAHVGDSRTYMYYKGQLFLLTIDHNVETFLENGWMTEEEVAFGAKKGALTRALGLTPKCEVDLYSIDILPGQIFLSCSDGLYGMVDDRQILNIIKQHSRTLEDLPKALIKEANKNGGKDNITVLAAAVEL